MRFRRLVGGWLAFLGGRRLRNSLGMLLATGLALVLSSCATSSSQHKVVISAADQKAVLMKLDEPVKEYKISTSKYGLGDQKGSYRTPLGKMQVARKIGGNQPSGMVFKSRRPTGEVLKPNAPGRDPIVTRILWLRGLEGKNSNAYPRCIYIHGTPEEKTLGTPASYGCIRMASKDVIDLYKRVPIGTPVYVTTKTLESKVKRPPSSRSGATPPTTGEDPAEVVRVLEGGEAENAPKTAAEGSKPTVQPLIMTGEAQAEPAKAEQKTASHRRSSRSKRGGV